MAAITLKTLRHDVYDSTWGQGTGLDVDDLSAPRRAPERRNEWNSWLVVPCPVESRLSPVFRRLQGAYEIDPRSQEGHLFHIPPMRNL